MTGRAWLIVGALLAAFVAGWLGNGWRLGSAHGVELKVAAEEYARKLKAAETERDDLVDKLADSNDKHMQDLKGAQDETNHLRDCVRLGTCGLRIAAKCPSVPGQPQAPAGAGMDPAAGPRLAGDAESDYFALRDGIDRTLAQLAACQDQLRARVGQ